MRALRVVILILALTSTAVGSPRPHTFTVSQVIARFNALRGHDIAIQGYARFDRLSRQALLYDSLASFRKHDFKRAIFLGFPLPTFDRFVLPDGTYACVTGYLSEDSHGSLGVYPGHLYADSITPLHRRATTKPDQAMQRTAR